MYYVHRKTFLYDIGEYDHVFVITDSPEIKESQNTLLNALKIKNKHITVVRWY